MNKIVITAIALCSLQGYATTGGDSAPLWLNHPAISPDGKTVAFSYKGNIYTVPATGGEARASPEVRLAPSPPTRHTTLILYGVRTAKP